RLRPIGGTCRPTERGWSEDREPGAAPPPTARTDGGGDPGRAGAGGRGRPSCSRASIECAARGGDAPAAPDPRLTRASLTATSPRWPRARAEAAGVAAEATGRAAGREGGVVAAGDGGGGGSVARISRGGRLRVGYERHSRV